MCVCVYVCVFLLLLSNMGSNIQRRESVCMCACLSIKLGSKTWKRNCRMRIQNRLQIMKIDEDTAINTHRKCTNSIHNNVFVCAHVYLMIRLGSKLGRECVYVCAINEREKSQKRNEEKKRGITKKKPRVCVSTARIRKLQTAQTDSG